MSSEFIRADREGLLLTGDDSMGLGQLVWPGWGSEAVLQVGPELGQLTPQTQDPRELLPASVVV